MDASAVENPQCPSWATFIGYLGVSCAMVMSNWGSAVSSRDMSYMTGATKDKTYSCNLRMSSATRDLILPVESLCMAVVFCKHTLKT